MTQPQLVLLAGPNGAGKSTFQRTFLAAHALPFLNADAVAAQTKVDSQEAARILDHMRDQLIADGRGFVTETVFSDPYGVKLEMLRKAIAAGFDVRLIYIGLESPELSARRVEQRVATGGHDVPRDRLPSRYERSLANLRAALAFVPVVHVFDNSLRDRPFRPIARFAGGKLVWRAKDVPAWAQSTIG